jgi:hypothetical protein
VALAGELSAREVVGSGDRLDTAREVVTFTAREHLVGLHVLQVVGGDDTVAIFVGLDATLLHMHLHYTMAKASPNASEHAN